MSEREYSDVPGLIRPDIYLHNRVAPSVHQKDNGYKEWWLNNKLHRDDGPAVEHINGDQEYYFNGLRHRYDGPAVLFINGYKEYWVNGIQLSKELFNATYQYLI